MFPVLVPPLSDGDFLPPPVVLLAGEANCDEEERR